MVLITAAFNLDETVPVDETVALCMFVHWDTLS